MDPSVAKVGWGMLQQKQKKINGTTPTKIGEVKDDAKTKNGPTGEVVIASPCYDGMQRL